MATQQPISIQRRRGTTTAHKTFTGAVGEITIDTIKKAVVVHDGVTAGGTTMAVEPKDSSAAKTYQFSVVAGVLTMVEQP